MKFLGIVTAILVAMFATGGEEREASQLSDTVIIGDAAAVMALSGSGAVLETAAIRTQSYDDVNRVLRRVPGVYVREEDGFGLFPNLSLRGVDTNRSSKLTMMEDGILTAPAPYSAPSAYYSPTVGRMSGVEVLKGSSQVRYGPHTTGGAINYLSTPIPEAEQGYLKLSLGTDEEMRIHGHYGTVVETELGRVGLLVEGYYRQAGGFRIIDGVDGETINRDDTGFENMEPMLKLSWEPKTYRYQQFELKLGYTDRVANETYLGLTDADFAKDSTRRYAATRFDQIEADHTRNYLKHVIDLSDTVMLETTLYHNRLHRNWYKLNKVNGNDLSGALAAGGADLDTLRGLAAGTFRVKANNRNYELYGAQTTASWDLDEHQLTLGARYHTDWIRRYQWEDRYTQDASGAITGIESFYKGPDSAGDRWQETQAVALFVEDEITVGQLTLTPGIRFESLEYEHIRYDNGTRGRGSLGTWAAGLGATYEVDEQNTVFGGIHRGISTPGPRANLANGIEHETSLALELGLRHDNGKGFSSELVLFRSAFDNLFVDGNVGGTGSGDSDNAGSVISQGLELKASYDAGEANDWSFSQPTFVSLTATDATLDGDAKASDPESIFAGGKDGNRVPYIPQLQLTVGTGIAFERWGLEVLGTWVDETYTTADNVSNSTTDVRFGKTDDYLVVDLAAWYSVSEIVKITGSVRNLLDDEYVVTRHPHGARGGRPISAILGLEIQF